MHTEIKNQKSYLSRFEGPPSDRDLRAEALKHALDIRKFEIGLYWKRATYFWTLIAASFAGYFALQNVDSSNKSYGSIFLIACIGFLLSLGWYLVNRGSKFWQENWERHVDVLEDQIIGPLYRTVLAKEEFQFWKPHDGFPFSVSRINQLISLFVTFVWLGLAINAFPFFKLPSSCISVKYWGLAALTTLFAILLICLGWPKREAKERRVNFRIAPLRDVSKNKSPNHANAADVQEEARD